jgi:hypothetical protein
MAESYSVDFSQSIKMRIIPGTNACRSIGEELVPDEYVGGPNRGPIRIVID